jgi:hypothetical protein
MPISIKCLLIFISMFSLQCTGSLIEERIQKNDFTLVEVGTNHLHETSLSELFDSLRFVLLETTDNSGIVSIKRIKFIDKRIFILDERANNLLVFSNDGKFVGNIGNLGSGPGEFQDAADFDIDFESKTILVLEKDRQEIITFDLEGNFLSSLKIEFQADQFTLLGNDKIAFFIGYFDDDFCNLRITNRRGKLLFKGFKFPSEKKTFPFGFTGHIASNKNSIIYSDAISSNIYEINGDIEIRKIFEIDFKNQFWKEDEIYEHNRFMEEIQRGNVNFLRNDYYVLDNAFVFSFNEKANNPKDAPNRPFTAYFLKNERRTYYYKNLRQDLLSLCLSGPKGTTDSGEFVSIIEPQRFRILKDRIQVIPDYAYYHQYLDSAEEQNPILVFYSFR